MPTAGVLMMWWLLPAVVPLRITIPAAYDPRGYYTVGVYRGFLVAFAARRAPWHQRLGLVLVLGVAGHALFSLVGRSLVATLIQQRRFMKRDEDDLAL